MRNAVLFLTILIGFANHTSAQSLYFPPLTGNTWDTLSAESLGWCTDKIDSLYDYLGNRNTKAFILLKDGKIVLEKYYGSFTKDSLWYWASAGKTITSFTTGIAQQEGYLSISDSTSKYLGAGWTVAPPNKERLITIRHQLTMTSGLDDGVADPHCTLDTCLEYLADAGTRWAYHNGPYTRLDGVIEAATGQSLNTYFALKVKNQTGITGSFYPSGYDNVFVSKARSMARFGLLILNHGKWNSTVIMSDTSYFNQMVNTSQSLNPSYGYFWWLNGKSSFRLPTLQISFPGPLNVHAPSDMFAAVGKNGQLLNVVPSRNLVFVRMGNAPGASQEVTTAFNDTIWQKLNLVICNANTVKSVGTESVKIYPNPSHDLFKVEFDSPHYTVEVINMTGEVVMRKKSSERTSTIDASTLPDGIYFVRCSDAERSVTKKVVITR
jgi:CubicO group peptidase (beta-lactamase class C family)